MLGITIYRERYERWWLGKYCRPVAYSSEPFKKVIKISLFGPPSFVYGNITFHYEDGTEHIVAGADDAYRPRRCDVEIKEGQ